MSLQIKRRNPDGTLGDFVSTDEGETPKEKLERLEAENATLLIRIALLEAKANV